MSKTGRPSKPEQIVIQEKLRPYFERNQTASFAAIKTGINVKTAYKYYDGWQKIIVESQNEDLLERRITEREEMIAAYDMQIQRVHDCVETVKEQITNYPKDTTPPQLFGTYLESIKHLDTLMQRKEALKLQLLFADNAVERRKEKPKSEISEDKIKNIITEIVKKEQITQLDEERIIHRIMRIENCELKHARAIFSQILEVGLQIFTYDGSMTTYDLGKFAFIRHYISDEEFQKIMTDRKSKVEQLIKAKCFDEANDIDIVF